MATLGALAKYFATANETGTLTLTSTTSGGTATVPVTTLASNYSNGDMVSLVIEPGTASQQVFMGEVSGANVINSIWTEGSNVSHAAGSSIVDYVTATQKAAETKGLLVEHGQSGVHTNITSTTVTTSGDATVGGNAAVTGTLAATGALSTASKTATRKDESGNVVAIDPLDRNEGFQGKDFAQTGLVSTTSAGLTAAISAGTYYISGKRYTYAGGTKLLTASKDSYLDINTSGTITEATATIGAASPALTANSIRISKILTAGASITSHNTGLVLATAFDSLGNRIKRNNQFDKVIGYAEITSSFTSTVTPTATGITGLISIAAIVPTGGRNVECEAFANSMQNNTGTRELDLYIFRGSAAGTQIGQGHSYRPTANEGDFGLAKSQTFESAGTGTFTAAFSSNGAGTTSVVAGASAPAYIIIREG